MTTTTPTIVNTAMAEHWDGAEGDDWTDNAEHYDATGRFITEVFNTAVAIRVGEDVLDIGCGTGLTTREAAKASATGRVVGVDLSSRMLEYARIQSAEAGTTNIEYVRADAQVHEFPEGTFDVAISSFGAMFFGDSVAALKNIRRALRPGGRLVLQTWQPFQQNEWLTAMFETLGAGRDLPTPPSGVPGPFGLAGEAAVRQILQDAGYTSIELTPTAAPMWLGRDAVHAWEFVSGMGIVRGLTAGLDAVTREAALGRLRELITSHETLVGVLLGAAEWLITAESPGQRTE